MPAEVIWHYIIGLAKRNEQFKVSQVVILITRANNYSIGIYGAYLLISIFPCLEKAVRKGILTGITPKATTIGFVPYIIFQVCRVGQAPGIINRIGYSILPGGPAAIIARRAGRVGPIWLRPFV
jgi:hypothetical protein